MKEIENPSDKLAEVLKAHGIRIREIAVENDPWGYTGIRVHYEISIDKPDAEEHRQLFTIIHEAIPYFLASEVLQRLFLQTTIYDDKVSVEPFAFERVDLINWYSGRLNDEAIWDRRIGYWHSAHEYVAQSNTAYVFAVCFHNRSIIGLQRNGKWYLPGGIVKGKEVPPEIQNANVYDSLKWYMQQQTGLRITGLSHGHVLEGKNAPPNDVVIVLNHIIATNGELSAGTLIPLDALPVFAPEYGDPRDYIRWSFNSFRQTEKI
jgi:hypothetical protein